MTTERDDDALSWAGDSDPTLEPGLGKTEPALPDGWSVAGGTTGEAEAAATATRHGTSSSGNPSTATGQSVALVGTGILAGIYLLYTIGWFIGGQRIGNPIDDPVGQFMFSLGAWLAVAAPVIWFGAAYWLTGRRPRARIAWLLTGVVVLAPLPFIFGAGGIS